MRVRLFGPFHTAPFSASTRPVQLGVVASFLAGVRRHAGRPGTWSGSDYQKSIRRNERAQPRVPALAGNERPRQSMKTR